MGQGHVAAVRRVLRVDTYAATKDVVVCKQAGDIGGHGEEEDPQPNIVFEPLSQTVHWTVSPAEAVSLRGSYHSSRLLC